LREVGGQNVGVEDRQVRCVVELLGEVSGQTAVGFNGDDALGAGQEVTRQRAAAGADLDYQGLADGTRRFRDALKYRANFEKMLT
jgi:hypothetical protein